MFTWGTAMHHIALDNCQFKRCLYILSYGKAIAAAHAPAAMLIHASKATGIFWPVHVLRFVASLAKPQLHGAVKQSNNVEDCYAFAKEHFLFLTFHWRQQDCSEQQSVEAPNV